MRSAADRLLLSALLYIGLVAVMFLGAVVRFHPRFLQAFASFPPALPLNNALFSQARYHDNAYSIALYVWKIKHI